MFDQQQTAFNCCQCYFPTQPMAMAGDLVISRHAPEMVCGVLGQAGVAALMHVTEEHESKEGCALVVVRKANHAKEMIKKLKCATKSHAHQVL